MLWRNIFIFFIVIDSSPPPVPLKHREHGAGDDPHPQEGVCATDQAGDDKPHCHPLHNAASQKP